MAVGIPTNERRRNAGVPVVRRVVIAKSVSAPSRPLDQLQSLEAGMTALADDQMIMHGNAKRFGDVDDRFCHLDVGARGRRITGRMIMHKPTRCHRVLK
jgi:hypothetical protein